MVLKTASKLVIQKATATTEDLIGNKIHLTLNYKDCIAKCSSDCFTNKKNTTRKETSYWWP